MKDQWLHDYLDGRLSAEERAKAETRLREDDGLARRVAELREIGRTLRADPAELSPGFYTRAKTRFAQSRGERPRFVHQLFSWEAAGLTAAMVLVVALFLPGLMRDPSPVPVPQAETSAPADRPIVPEPEPPNREIAATGKTSAGADVSDRLEKEADPAPANDYAPVPTGREKRRTPAPIAVAPAAPGEETRIFAESASGHRASRALEQSVSTVPLPRDVAIPDGIRIVADRATWDEWLAGPAGPALGRLGGYEPGRRLVLVGRPDGIDCSALVVSRLQNEYHVGIGDDAGTASGCAFVLPADGAAVTLDE